MVSLDVAKDLKAAGWPQDVNTRIYAVDECDGVQMWYCLHGPHETNLDQYAAPSLEHLLAELPSFFEIEDEYYGLALLKDDPTFAGEPQEYVCGTQPVVCTDNWPALFRDENPADAAALLWIWNRNRMDMEHE